MAHLIKLDKIRWHVLLKWPMVFKQIEHPMLVNKPTI